MPDVTRCCLRITLEINLGDITCRVGGGGGATQVKHTSEGIYHGMWYFVSDQTLCTDQICNFFLEVTETSTDFTSCP